MDPIIQHYIHPGCRRSQSSHGDPHGTHWFYQCVCQLEYQYSSQRVFLTLFTVKYRSNGCVSISGFLPVLHLLGSDASTYVFPDRNVGRPPAGICCYQIFPLYIIWFGSHAYRNFSLVFYLR